MITDTPELDFTSPQTRSRADQIFAAFKDFHRANPIVWQLFDRFAHDLIAKGFKNYSADGIFERIRWHVDVELAGTSQVKLNNNFRAYYARLFDAAHPEHVGFFRNRKRKSADIPADPSRDGGEVARSPDEIPDTELTAKLIALLPQ